MSMRGVGWIVLGLGLGLLVGTGCTRQRGVKVESKTRVVPVTVAPVRHATVERTVDVVGSLRGWEDVTIGTKQSGRVARVRHDIGDRVQPGEPLIELETVDADLAIRQAQRKMEADLAKLGLTEVPPKGFDISKVPSVAQAQVALDRARRELERQQGLLNRRAGSVEEFQNAENDLRSAEAVLENAVVTAKATLSAALASEVAIEVAEQQRKDTIISAPVPSAPPDGLDTPLAYAVTERKVSEGQMLRQGDPVADLVVENPLRLRANVPERYVDEIKEGQEVRLDVMSHPGELYTGRVSRINPAIDPVSRTFEVEARITNDEGLLRPGGFAKAAIITHSDSEAVVVPTEAIIRFAGGTKIFLIRNDAAQEVRVETGLVDPQGQWVEVIGLSGPIPTDAPVVTTGQTQLTDGSSVTIKSTEPVPSSEPPTATRSASLPSTSATPIH